MNKGLTSIVKDFVAEKAGLGVVDPGERGQIGLIHLAKPQDLVPHHLLLEIDCIFFVVRCELPHSKSLYGIASFRILVCEYSHL